MIMAIAIEEKGEPMKQKLIDCINGVLKHLPWGEISSHTAEDIAERLIEEGFVTDTNVGGKYQS